MRKTGVRSSPHDIIVIGGSAGGIEAIQSLARGLPADLDAAVLIVIHTSPVGDYLLPEILTRVSKLPAARIAGKTLIERGKLYAAPPDRHLLVKGRHLVLSNGPKEQRARPSIDRLFRSAAESCGPRVVGVILTGMLHDGTAGLHRVKELGGIAVVQDPLDAAHGMMPASALSGVVVDYVRPLSEIAPLLVRLVSGSRATAGVPAR